MPGGGWPPNPWAMKKTATERQDDSQSITPDSSEPDLRQLEPKVETLRLAVLVLAREIQMRESGR
jgi:hypothetical protein